MMMKYALPLKQRSVINYYNELLLECLDFIAWLTKGRYRNCLSYRNILHGLKRVENAI